MKRLFSVAKFSLFLFLAFAFSANAYYNPGNPTGFVNDYARILSAEQKQALESNLSQFEKSSGNEISVAIIPDLQGDTIENFADELFKQWGVGKKGKDNGVLILVALQDRRMRIEVGYGLEGVLTDAQASWIIDDIMKPAFRANNYFQGINGAVEKVKLILKGDNSGAMMEAANDKQGKKNFVDAIIAFAIWGGLILIYSASILARSKSWWLGGVVGAFIGFIVLIASESIVLGGFAIVVFLLFGLLFDYFVSKSYQKGRKNGHIPWWIGGGTGRGGSSGGFGGFGGFGGGGSGGGGSSGSW